MTVLEAETLPVHETSHLRSEVAPFQDNSLLFLFILMYTNFIFYFFLFFINFAAIT